MNLELFLGIVIAMQGHLSTYATDFGKLKKANGFLPVHFKGVKYNSLAAEEDNLEGRIRVHA